MQLRHHCLINRCRRNADHTGLQPQHIRHELYTLTKL
jgi:hypothetical protein